jgi:hypothetical protein
VPEQVARSCASAEPNARLAGALEREMGMDGDDAREIAAVVLSAFDEGNELDDREIESDVRSVFYELEEQKLLDFRREEYRNEEGHKRRAFYWTIRWDEIAPEEADDASGASDSDDVYDELPSDAWRRQASA